jgi:hypothetical protein
MMVRRIAVLVMLIAAFALQGQAPVASAAVEKIFVLSVKFLGGPEMTLEVALDQPFDNEVKDEKGVVYAVGGMVLPPVGEQYPVVLTTLVWGSEKSNTFGTSKGMYTLGKPISGGSNTGGKSVTLYLKKPPSPGLTPITPAQR